MQYDGREVIAIVAGVTKAAAVVSQSLTISGAGVDWHIGDDVPLAMRTKVAGHRFMKAPKGDGLVLVLELEAYLASPVDDELVAGALDRMRDKIMEAAGVPPLPFGDDGEPAGDDGDPADE
jgi:hypothetical protein